MDSLDFAEAVTNDSPYEYMEKELSRDMRRNKIRGDLAERFQEYKQYSNSQLSHDVEKVVKLLGDQEVQIKDLRSTLNAYGFDTEYQNKLLHFAGENDKRVRSRRNSYVHSTTFDDIILRKV